jgi:uncharacterized tellurite resistance protein B-like protein
MQNNDDKALFVHALLLTCYSDGELQEEELATVESYSKTLPELKDTDFSALFEAAKLKATSAKSIDDAVALLSPLATRRHLARKAYLCCCELALSAEGMSDAEEKMLQSIQQVLEISQEEADKGKEVFSAKYYGNEGSTTLKDGNASQRAMAAIKESLAQDNPWMTIGIMNDVKDGDLMEAWQKYLDIQTQMLGPVELGWFKENGFGSDGSRVIEVGSAAGTYGSYVAHAFPNATFFGLEANENFIKNLDSTNFPSNYTTSHCMVGRDPVPQDCANAEQCYLRYVLQHISNPGRVLRSLHSELAPGAKVFIIEEDDEFFSSFPPYQPFDTVTDAWRRICKVSGTDSRIGRKLPIILAESGFKVEKFEICLRTNTELGDNFINYFKLMSKIFYCSNSNIMPQNTLSMIEREFEEVRRSHKNTFTATYPHVLVVATRI